MKKVDEGFLWVEGRGWQEDLLKQKEGEKTGEIVLKKTASLKMLFVIT